MNLKELNKTGIILRALGIFLLLIGVFYLFVPFFGILLYGGDISDSGLMDIDYLLTFGLGAVLLLVLGILFIRQSRRALYLARILNIGGAALLAAILVFLARGGEGFGYPGLGIFFFLPIYIPFPTLFHWFLEAELDKIRGAKLTSNKSIGRIFLPGFIIVGTYILVLLIFT